ncbi:MAG TPA: PEP-CTERM sorting domain-containing protein [Oxalicibacterium sp.]|jgi:hypothetical protein|nr:PEP-CTERM sorting domain-containing protein [Oxalicibacterium sp.]
MKIKYFLVLLFLGVSLNASANNGGHHNSWSNPSSYDVFHDIVIGSHGDLKDFFGFDRDKAKHELGWIFGNLNNILGDLKDNWRWSKSPFCDWPPVISPVPEPESWGMMLGGLAMMGWLARRRKAHVGR